MPHLIAQRRKFFEEAAEQFKNGVNPEIVGLYTPAIQDARRWYAKQPDKDDPLLVGIDDALLYFKKSGSETGTDSLMWFHKSNIAKLLRTYAGAMSRAMGDE